MKAYTAFLFALLALFAGNAKAEAPQEGISLYGKPKYAEGFTHFDYANPEAPKGGEIKLAALGTFDSLNPFILKGVAADGSDLVFAKLMESSLDEPFSEYGLIAESVTVAPDKSWVSYKIRPSAKFQDGKPITADDVIFSFDILKQKGHPFYRSYYKDVAKAEKLGLLEVRFSFKEKGNTELPMIMGQLPVLSKAFWKGRDFSATILSPIVGSGPYKITEVVPGRTVVYSLDKNWWGKDLPAAKGRYNFQTLRYDYYRDTTVALEAFLAGQVDFRAENIAKNWATAYTTPAVKQGLIKLQEIKNELPSGMQGFVFNLRKPMFQDVRVRRAIDLAFDFEWTNKNVAFGAYKRTASYFENSEMAAHGLPSKEELAVLEPYRGKVPDEVFSKAYEPPKTDGSGNNRENLRKAAALLKDAGWVLKDGFLVNGKGEPFVFEIVDQSPIFERWIQPFVRNLERLGIKASLRVVDSSQYQSMLDDFNFDMIAHVFPQSLSPGNEQRDYWSSGKADLKGSKNLIGIKDPVVDNLVEKIVHAKDRSELVTLCKALDRVLLWGDYVVPHWYTGVYRVAYWDKFGQPSVSPKYGLDFIDGWWIDPGKAKNDQNIGKKN